MNEPNGCSLPEKKKKKFTWFTWVFLFPFNSAAFFKIGSKAQNKMWILFGWVYLITGIGPGCISALAPFLSFLIHISAFSWVASIVHAFVIKSKYENQSDFTSDNEKYDAIVSKGKKISLQTFSEKSLGPSPRGWTPSAPVIIK